MLDLDNMPVMKVVVYSHDADVRAQIRLAIGRRPAMDVPDAEITEVATQPALFRLLDAGGADVMVLDGEAQPIGGMGLCRQAKDEIYKCPPVLLLSSVTCQMGVFAVERGQIKRTRGLFHPMSWGLREWYVLSLLMGTYFVCGQGYEYLDLIRKQGLTLSSSNYGSVFYLTTGFHGLHVTGGLIAFIFLLGRTYAAKRFTHEQQVSAIVVSYYWHFVDVVWIALFTTIYLIH